MRNSLPWQAVIEIKNMTPHTVPFERHRTHVGPPLIGFVTTGARQLLRAVRTHEAPLQMEVVIQFDGRTIHHLLALVESHSLNNTVPRAGQ